MVKLTQLAERVWERLTERWVFTALVRPSDRLRLPLHSISTENFEIINEKYVDPDKVEFLANQLHDALVEANAGIPLPGGKVMAVILRKPRVSSTQGGACVYVDVALNLAKKVAE